MPKADRRERNRVYAKMRREEHAIYLDLLHAKLETLTKENAELRETIASLTNKHNPWDCMPPELGALSVEEVSIDLWTE